VLFPCLICGLLLLTYAQNMNWLWSRWMNNPDYSHGPLIPLISLFIVYQKREELKNIAIDGTNWGLLILAAAIIVQIVSLRAQINFINSYSLILSLAGIILYLYGKRMFRALIFPLCYLIFMVPFWGAFMDKLANYLKVLSSILSFYIIQLFGFPVFLEGVVLHLPKGSLEVADPCSGIRSLFSLLALGTLIAYMSSGGVVKKISIVAFALVLAVIGNSLRVTTLAIILQETGKVITEGTLHSAIGLGVFIFALGGLLLYNKLVK